jgi:hypothetical protein
LNAKDAIGIPMTNSIENWTRSPIREFENQCKKGEYYG